MGGIMKSSSKHLIITLISGIIIIGFAILFLSSNFLIPHYECSRQIINYTDALKIPSEIYTPVVHYLPFSGTDENLLKGGNATPKQVEALQLFYNKTKHIIERTPPGLQAKQPDFVKIGLPHYRQLLGNKMNAIRALCDYIELDITQGNKTAALNHFAQIVQLTQTPMGIGDKLIYWRILSNFSRITEQLIHHFTLKNNELAFVSNKFDYLLALTKEHLLQIKDVDLIQQIGGERFKNKKTKELLFSNQKKALLYAEYIKHKLKKQLNEIGE